MKKLFLSIAVLLLATMQVCAQANIAGTLYASNFAQWTVSQGNNGPYSWSSSSVCTQATSGGVTFRPFTVGTPIRIVDTATPGNTENVTVTAVNINGSGCNIATSAAAHNHYSFYLASATAGLQEAINYSKQSLGTSNPASVVIVTPAWSTAGGVTSMITPGAQGSVAISILDERTSVIVPYTWQSTLYVAQTFGGLPGGTTGSIQYNCAGAFCGSAAITNAAGDFLQPNNTFSNKEVVITNTAIEGGAAYAASYAKQPNCTDFNGLTFPCGTNFIAPGTYTWSTQPTVHSPYVGASANNVTVNYTGTATGWPALNDCMLTSTTSSEYTFGTNTSLIGGYGFNVIGNSTPGICGIYFNQQQAPKINAGVENFSGTGSVGVLSFAFGHSGVDNNTERGEYDLTLTNNFIGFEKLGADEFNTSGYDRVNLGLSVGTGQTGYYIAGSNHFDTNSNLTMQCNLTGAGTCWKMDPGNANFYSGMFSIRAEQTGGSGGTFRNFGANTTFAGLGYISTDGVVADTVTTDISCAYYLIGSATPFFQCRGGVPISSTDGTNTSTLASTGLTTPSITDSGLTANRCVHTSTGGLFAVTATDCVAIPTYTIGITALTPNGSNQSITFATNPAQPTFNFNTGCTTCQNLNHGFIDVDATTFQYPFMVMQFGGTTNNCQIGEVGVSSLPSLYSGCTTGHDVVIGNCIESGSPTCSDGLVFATSAWTTGPTSYGSIAQSGASFANAWTFSKNGATSSPTMALTGTWFTGGSNTTTKPQFLIEPVGTTSTGWNTNGTGLGVNAASGFTGYLADLQLNGVTKFHVDSTGLTAMGAGSTVNGSLICTAAGVTGCAAGSGTVNSGTIDGIAYYTGTTAVSSTTAPTTSGHVFVPCWQPTGSVIAPTVCDFTNESISPGFSSLAVGPNMSVTNAGAIGTTAQVSASYFQTSLAAPTPGTSCAGNLIVTSAGFLYTCNGSIWIASNGTPATWAAGTGVTSVTCADAASVAVTCTSASGSLIIVGGTATTGTIATATWTAEPSKRKCSFTMNGNGSTGTAGFDIGHTAPTTTGVGITAGLTVLGATIFVDYACTL